MFNLNEEGNGHVGAMFKFDRIATEALLEVGEEVELTMYGEIRDTTWFVATDVIRVIAPKMRSYGEGTTMPAGGDISISWTNPESPRLASSDVVFSADDGETWTVVATDVRGTQVNWRLPSVDVEAAHLRVIAKDAEGNTIGYDTIDEPFAISSEVTSVQNPAIPRTWALNQNAPNPFNPQTKIEFALPRNAETTLKIFDSRGRVVRTLVAGELEAGYHTVIWSGEDDGGRQVASGVYFYRLVAGDFTAKKSMVLLK